MWAILKRELNGFFNSLGAYVVIAVFLGINGLFLWVFPGGYNIPDAGYANLDGFFVLAPFVFLFLIPAITMRFFAEEKRTGTMEMLLTKPVTPLQIVLAKYFAGVIIVVVSLLPTLIFLFTIGHYAAPPGIDTGGIWGSYAGLVLLGMVFVAVGTFASALSDNQVLAFIIAMFVCGFLFIGFELLHGLRVFGNLDMFVKNLGLFAHYSSMGRGVLDSRDLTYFISVMALFLSLALFVSMTKKQGQPSLLQLAYVLVIIIALNTLSSYKYFRLDLTDDKRYSLTPATKNMLSELEDVIWFRVYLDGDLPAEFRKLRNDTREMLDEFAARTDQIQYEFISPLRAAGDDRKALQEYYSMLSSKGLEAAQVQIQAGDGSAQRVIFPGALVSYRGREIPVNLLQERLGLSVVEVLHNSSLALEYNLASAMLQVTREEKERIAFVSGHGTYASRYLASATKALEAYYQVDRIRGLDNFEALKQYRTLIFAKPREPFSEQDKYLLDQFLMQGGSMLWLVDPVVADMDSLMGAYETLGIARDINLDDFFFRYGVRLNPVLLQDLNAAPIPVTTGFVAGQPVINLLPWYFFPVITPLSDHEVVNNLNVIRTEFVSTIDTVEASGVQKTILLESSSHSRVVPVPVRISLDLLERPVSEHLFRGPPRAVAVLLEGTFESLYRNRIPPDVQLPDSFQRRDSSETAAMIVVADGDIIRNQFGSDGRPLPLGFDRYTGQQFGNMDFILNAVNYLTDDSGIISSRVKEIRLRLLDGQRLHNNLVVVQLANTLLPVLILLLFGSLRVLLRKRRYTR
ncbi:MAG: gliding motility-associated ABC transporter substrate-binding protein GldG [Bacteroidales bacterium]|nr:gliding motility-associated ABC transporter substrate-binding protein GldG [Bacteroidales bacterium]